MTFGFGNQHSIQLSYGRVPGKVYRLLPCPSMPQLFQGEGICDYNARVCNELEAVSESSEQRPNQAKMRKRIPSFSNLSLGSP